MDIFKKNVLDLSNLKNNQKYGIKRRDGDLLIIYDYESQLKGLADLNMQIIKEPTFDVIDEFKDGLAVAQKEAKDTVINKFGEIILISTDQLHIEKNYIIETLYDNKYNIYDKKGKLIANNIDTYSDKFLIRNDEDEFNLYGYDIINSNGNIIAEVPDYDDIAFYSDNIIKYYKRNKVYIIDNFGEKKFKAKNVKIINKNKYLLLDKEGWHLIEDDKEILSFNGKYNVEINKKYGIVFVGSNNEYWGFINVDNKYIQSYFTDYKVIKDNRIVLGINGRNNVMDFDGNNLSPEMRGKVNYDEKLNLYNVLDYSLNYTILNDRFETIFKHNGILRTISDKLFLVTEDNKTKLVDSNKKVLAVLNENINLVKIKTNDNLILITIDNKSMLINDQGNVIIPFATNCIDLIGDNKITIDGHMVDLNSENTNINMIYKVAIKVYNKNYSCDFKTEEAREKFINEIAAIEKECDNNLKHIKEQADNDIESSFAKVKKKDNFKNNQKNLLKLI